MGGSHGPSGWWPVGALLLVAGLPVLAYVCGASGLLGQLIGWLFS